MIPIRDNNPTERFPIVTVALIVINTVVFVHQLLLNITSEEKFIAAFSLVPARLFGHAADVVGTMPVGVTIFSSMFLHGGPLHIAGNMLYLWIFGNNVEDAMGRVRFLVFYLLCGVVAAYAHAFTNTFATTPMIGASGAISGVIGAYLLLYPRARVLTLIAFGFYLRMIEIPAMFVLGFWVVLQFLNALVAFGAGGGVAWYAHLGGFAAGMVLIGPFKRKNVPFWGGRRVLDE